MKIRTILYITLFIFFYLTNSSAEDKFMHITVKDGLTQSSVKTIYQDFNGYIWFGTADGLNKYDGFEITKFYYDHTKSNSLCSNDITCIYENPYDSTLFIGTFNSGISLYNSNNDSFESFNNILKSSDRQNIRNISSIHATDRNNLWILSYGDGIFNYNLGDSSLYSPSFNTNPTFQKSNCIITDSEGKLWIGTDNGLYLWNPINSDFPKKIKLSDTRDSISISKLKFDIKGNLYIGTINVGLLKYNPYSRSIKTIYKPQYNGIQTSHRINDILITKNNILWIATASGLFKIENSKLVVYRNNPLNNETINNNVILNLFEDKSGIIWIGTFLGGINMFDPKTTLFSKYKDFYPLLDATNEFYHNYNNIYAIFVDNNKSVWVKSSGGLLEMKQTYFTSRQVKGNIIKHYDEPLIGNIYYNKNNGLFLSFGKGICLRQNNGKLIKLYSDILKQTGKSISSFIFAYTDSDGIIWFSTKTGLLRYNSTNHTFKLVRLVTKDNKKLTLNISSIIENYEGKLLLGTNSGKLFKFDRYLKTIRQIVPFNNSAPPKFSRIFSIHESSPEQIWLGTNTGLYNINIKTKTYKQFLIKNDQSTAVVYGILVDKRNNIWYTSNNGLTEYNPKNRTFQHYTYYEGLQSNEFNQNSFFQSDDGTFYIGGINGINLFNPENIQPDNLIPPLIIDKLEILYEPVTPVSHPDILRKKICETKSITLSYKQATFSFEYIALSFRQPDRIDYRYMLEGYDNTWIEAGNRRIATYTKVPPGEYNFKVLNTNNYGIWSKAPISIKIIIPPPYWQTNWFKFSLILIILSSFYIFFYLKIKSIKYQKVLLAKTVEEKTNTLNKQKIKIEQQNHELLSINKIITQKNEDLSSHTNQIREQHKELVLIASKLKKTNQAKLLFFTSISHEFRTPLTLIISPLQDIIKNTEKFNKVQLIRHLKTIYSNASKLLLLIDQLLDFRKAETGAEKLVITKLTA